MKIWIYFVLQFVDFTEIYCFDDFIDFVAQKWIVVVGLAGLCYQVLIVFQIL